MRYLPLTIAVPAIELTLELSELAAALTAGDTEHGRVVAVEYEVVPDRPDLSGLLLHFQLPDGRVVLSKPDGDGRFQLVWKDTLLPADISVDPYSVVYSLWVDVDIHLHRFFPQVLSKHIGNAVAKAIADVLTGL